jgi:hypothetical protein
MSVTATVQWAAVVNDVNGNPLVGAVTYNLYQNGTKVQTGLTALTATSGALTPGDAYVFAVSAENNGLESALDTAPSVTVPFPVPAAPTGVTVTLS